MSENPKTKAFWLGLAGSYCYILGCIFTYIVIQLISGQRLGLKEFIFENSTHWLFAVLLGTPMIAYLIIRSETRKKEANEIELTKKDIPEE